MNRDVNDPQWTVAIASCGRPAALARCLEAVVAGDHRADQILVVDQSRDPEIESVVHAANHRHAGILLERQPRLGLSASRNLAIRRATGDLMAITDDDCVPGPSWLSNLVAAFAGPLAPDVVTGRVLPLGPERAGTYAVSLRTREAREVFRGRAIPWSVGTGGNFAARRDLLTRVGGFDERLGAGSPGQAAEDAEILDRLLRVGALVVYEPAVVVYHERQPLAQRLASRRSYGFGIGALCGMRFRERDTFAPRMLASWIWHAGRAFAGATLRGDWSLARQRALHISGGARGLLHGLGLRR